MFWKNYWGGQAPSVKISKYWRGGGQCPPGLPYSYSYVMVSMVNVL